MSSNKRPHLTPSSSSKMPDSKRSKEGTEGDKQISYVVKINKDLEFEWFVNITVTAVNGNGGGHLPELQHKTHSAGCAPDENQNDNDHEDDFEENSEDDWDAEEEKEELIPNTVGRLFGRIIRRNFIRASFWRDMEEPSQDTSALGFDIFDRYGCLREEFVTGEKKGTGTWAHEMDTGNILQIETTTVDTSWRRQGIAFNMLLQVLQKAKEHDKWLSFAFAWPTALNYELEDHEKTPGFSIARSARETTAINLFRKAGFKRIGSSSWFGCAMDATHPSRAMINDYNPPNLRPDITELEKLRVRLERERTKLQRGFMTVVRSDWFRGHKDEDVKRLLELEDVNHDLSSPKLIMNTKYGCTCGDCLGGYLSPRMHYFLHTQAELKYDMENDMVGDVGEVEFDEFFIACMGWEYVPEPCQSHLPTNKSLRRGFCNVFRYIAECLEQKMLPTEVNVIKVWADNREWPPATKNYFERGGTVEAVLRALFQATMAQDDMTGDGMFFEVPEFKTEHNALAVCRNDREYGFVLGMLLGSPISVFPYIDDGQMSFRR